MSNLFTVNGVDDMDPYWNVNSSGTSGMLLGTNEIQEAVRERSYLAWFGGAGMDC